MKVAYLTGRTFRGAPAAADSPPGYEAPDYALMRAAGAARGIAFQSVYWDDPQILAQEFDAALVRSCWDYTHQVERFLSTLEAHARAGLRVINAPAVLRWNARKPYLQALAAAGLPVIPTFWTDLADAAAVAKAFEDLEAAELVVKPQVGAGSQATIRLQRNQWSAGDLIAGPQGPAMLQPFLPSIETEGELSLIYFGGALSHAIQKMPVPGKWFANDLKASFEAVAAPGAAQEIARAAIAAGEQLTGAVLNYARVDFVLAGPGDWRVIELEAIEPYLFLALAEGAADRFAGALASALEADARGA